MCLSDEMLLGDVPIGLGARGFGASPGERVALLPGGREMRGNVAVVELID
jgi:hypothetical protein